MKRELRILKDGDVWREYIIYSKGGHDQFFQGVIVLPFNPEVQKNSQEILDIIANALLQSGELK